MNLLTLLKILGIVIVVMTSIILPLSMLESSMADLTAEFIEWSGESKFFDLHVSSQHQVPMVPLQSTLKQAHQRQL